MRRVNERLRPSLNSFSRPAAGHPNVGQSGGPAGFRRLVHTRCFIGYLISGDGWCGLSKDAVKHGPF
ncbi:hypothetical protein RISK_001572 [Rhodopirellula islandica]|uniref:Uncharacterized protein n=1 Tax=Rhodopirellula islandica TaxID=595434 RepID=A0A0J1BIG2_RHOIS|nr:hypothetical protein RISK_001572 [Rhodopirellula islandica]